jgi:hypothetical protein
MKKGLLTLRQERDILTAKLDLNNATMSLRRTLSCAIDEADVHASNRRARLINLANAQINYCRNKLLDLVLPYATLRGEYVYETLAMQGEDGQEVINDLRSKIASRDASQVVEFMHVLEFPAEVARLLQ